MAESRLAGWNHDLSRPEFDPLSHDARVGLAVLAYGRGKVYKRRAPYKPRGRVGECWTNAWRLAERLGWDYAEGVTVSERGPGVTHAFVIDPKGRVHDDTPDYADTVEYRGFVLPKHVIRHATARWEGYRSSVLEALLLLDSPEASALLASVVALRGRPPERHSHDEGSRASAVSSAPPAGNPAREARSPHHHIAGVIVAGSSPADRTESLHASATIDLSSPIAQ